METIREDFFQETSAFTAVDKSALTEETNLFSLSVLSLFLINDEDYEKHKNLVSIDGIKTDLIEQLDTVKVMLGKEDRSIRLNISHLFVGDEVIFYHDGLRRDCQYNFTQWAFDLIQNIEITFEVELLKNYNDRFNTLGDILYSLEKSLEEKIE